MSAVLFSTEWFKRNPDCTYPVIKAELDQLKLSHKKLFFELKDAVKRSGFSWHTIEIMAQDWLAYESLYTEWSLIPKQRDSFAPEATLKGVYTRDIEAKIAFYQDHQETAYERDRLQSLLVSYQYKDDQNIMTLLAQYNFTCHTLPILISRLQKRIGEPLGIDKPSNFIETLPQIFVVI